jgi:hypothetical protein
MIEQAAIPGKADAAATTPAQNAAIDRAVNKVLAETPTPSFSEPISIAPADHGFFSGARARFATLAAVPMLVLAACGGGDKAPSTPTNLPTNSPALTEPATPSATDTKLATDSPKPVDTASPIPTATETAIPGEVDVTFASVIADLEAGGSALDKYTPITDATLRADYQPYVNDPDVQASRIVRNTNLLEECLKSPGPGSDNEQIQAGNCASELVQSLRLVAKLPGNSHVKLFASDMARFVKNSNLFKDSQAKADLLANLKAWAAA